MESWGEIEKYINNQRPSALREIGSHAIDPEDVLQVTRINVWKATKDGFDPLSIRSYVQTAIRNAVIDMKRKIHMRRDRNVTWTDSDKNTEVDAGFGNGRAGTHESYEIEPASTKDIDELESGMMVEWMLGHMSEQFSEVIMNRIEGTSGDDGASKMGTTKSAYKSILYRARQEAKNKWDILKTN